MRVFFERRGSVDDAQLPGHPEMDHQEQIARQVDEDEFPAPPHACDTHARHRVDECLGLRMSDDRRKGELAADDGAAGEMRPQVRDDGLHLW